MTHHDVGTREQWLAARRELLAREKELTRLSDQLAAQRRQLPWVPVEKPYRFTAEDGSQQTLAGLFAGRSQLLVYHFMFGPDWDAGCPSCSFAADHFDGPMVHLNARDVTLVAVSRAPIEKIAAYKWRMAWTFPWVSSHASDFNVDYGVSFTEQQQHDGAEYNFALIADPNDELPGVSAFALQDGVVYHTYSAYARGGEALLGAYHMLDLVPRGRDEDELSWTMAWLRRHDEYEHTSAGVR
jgi:predicted dithiol-disulfide oxidoreductase (DUF899 family)